MHGAVAEDGHHYFGNPFLGTWTPEGDQHIGYTDANKTGRIIAQLLTINGKAHRRFVWEGTGGDEVVEGITWKASNEFRPFSLVPCLGGKKLIYDEEA